MSFSPPTQTWLASGATVRIKAETAFQLEPLFGAQELGADHLGFFDLIWIDSALGAVITQLTITVRAPTVNVFIGGHTARERIGGLNAREQQIGFDSKWL